MWIKILIGAIAGLVVGHFVTPGYALWVIVGIILGFIVELASKKLRKSDEEKQVEKESN